MAVTCLHDQQDHLHQRARLRREVAVAAARDQVDQEGVGRRVASQAVLEEDAVGRVRVVDRLERQRHRGDEHL